jgi:hypothetical protein
MYDPVTATDCLKEPSLVSKPLRQRPFIYPLFRERRRPTANTKYASDKEDTPMFLRELEEEAIWI